MDRRQHESETIPSINVCIKEFKNKIREGPYYVCCVCNRMLHKKSVKNFIVLNTPINTTLEFRLHLMVRSIFVTHVTQKLNKVSVPRQAVINNMLMIHLLSLPLLKS